MSPSQRFGHAGLIGKLVLIALTVTLTVSATSSSVGAAPLFFGSASGIELNEPIVDMAAHPSGKGYWLTAADGGIFSFGASQYFGSTGSTVMGHPIVAMAAHPSGKGYWLAGGDGGVFSFGAAKYAGSLPEDGIVATAVDLAPHPSGNGYWVLTSDGTVYGYGAAADLGSASGRSAAPFVAIASTADGDGYWIAAADGTVAAFGSARPLGSMNGRALSGPVVDLGATTGAPGYWLVASDGGVFSFGAAAFRGSTATERLDSPIVAIAPGVGDAVGYWLGAGDGDVFTFATAKPRGPDAAASSKGRSGHGAHAPKAPATTTTTIGGAPGAGGAGSRPTTSAPAPSAPSAPSEPTTGLKLAFARAGAAGSSIWIANPDGSAAKQVTQPGAASDILPRWAPDMSALAFVRVAGDGTGEVFLADTSAAVVSTARRLTETRSANGGAGCAADQMDPVWSPDAARLAFTCAAGSASTVIVTSRAGTAFPAANDAAMADARPTWSPDSRTLAFARRDTKKRYGMPERVTIWTAVIDGGAASGHRRLIVGSNTANHPAWSPDGDRIAFVERNELTLSTSLAIYALSGGTITRPWSAPTVGRVQLYHLAWSPNSARVAFPAGDGNRTSTIHILDTSTGTVKPVTDANAPAYAPSWASDSLTIAYDQADGVRTWNTATSRRGDVVTGARSADWTRAA